jgi:hypothetical protein
MTMNIKVAIVPKKGADTVRLPGIGHAIGTPAGSLKKGDIMVWPDGQITTVFSVLKTSDKTITIKEVCTDKYGNTKLHERVFKKKTIIARPEHQLPVRAQKS